MKFYLLKQDILTYFPPVNPMITNVYEETYTSYKNYKSFSPLKVLQNKDIYSPEILKTLQHLRILLRSNINDERFIYELNLLVDSWGNSGYYNKSILNPTLISLISKINKEYTNNKLLLEEKLQKKLEKEMEMMKEGEKLTLDYQLSKLSDDLTNFKIKTNIQKSPRTVTKGIRKSKKRPSLQLDLSNLKL